jgi:crotonobetainyl-CoA:carnitine CoA-transferase CaiB-like acyl-CoA transferase
MTDGIRPRGPLADVRVLDLTQMLAGPFATAVLADLGADVVKVESPRGDFIRDQGPFPVDDETREYGGYFQSVNRNKRGIVLDLASPEGKAVLIRLAQGADLLIENFRYGVMDRLGLSYEVLHDHNPKLVYGAIRGFGDSRTGHSPMRDWPAYDVTAQAMSGFMEITGPADGPPMKAGPGIGDTVPALFLVAGVLAALHRAQKTGEGEFVDVAMYDALLAMCERSVYQYSYSGVVATRQGNAHPLLSPFDTLPTSDGWVTIAAPTDAQWARLAQLIGRPELAEDPELATAADRVRNGERVLEQLTAWTSARPLDEVVAVLGGKIAVGPVQNAERIFHDPHVKARAMLTEVEQPGYSRPVTIVGIPIKFAGLPAPAPRRAPLLGEHTAEVLRAIGGTSLETDPSARCDEGEIQSA